MPNTMPASGVLNAAATPALAPARIRPGCCRGDSRPTANMIEAPTCTVGPSRPIEAPHSRPTSSSAVLPSAVPSETRRSRAASPCNCRAAIACGIPLPPANGTTRSMAQADSANPSGVTTKAAYGSRPSSSAKAWLAPSAASAIAQAAAPTTMPPNTKMARRCHRTETSRMRRMRRGVNGWRSGGIARS